MAKSGALDFARYLSERFFNLADSTVTRITSIWTVVALCVTLLSVSAMEVFGLGKSPAFALELAERLGDLFATKWFAWGGWAFSLLLAILLAILVLSCYGAQTRQGDDLARLRSKSDPRRISSRDPKSLEQYPDKAAERRERKRRARSSKGGAPK